MGWRGPCHGENSFQKCREPAFSIFLRGQGLLFNTHSEQPLGKMSQTSNGPQACGSMSIFNHLFMVFGEEWEQPVWEGAKGAPATPTPRQARPASRQAREHLSCASPCHHTRVCACACARGGGGDGQRDQRALRPSG